MRGNKKLSDFRLAALAIGLLIGQMSYGQKNKQAQPAPSNVYTKIIGDSEYTLGTEKTSSGTSTNFLVQKQANGQWYPSFIVEKSPLNNVNVMVANFEDGDQVIKDNRDNKPAHTISTAPTTELQILIDKLNKKTNDSVKVNLVTEANAQNQRINPLLLQLSLPNGTMTRTPLLKDASGNNGRYNKIVEALKSLFNPDVVDKQLAKLSAQNLQQLEEEIGSAVTVTQQQDFVKNQVSRFAAAQLKFFGIMGWDQYAQQKQTSTSTQVFNDNATTATASVAPVATPANPNIFTTTNGNDYRLQDENGKTIIYDINVPKNKPPIKVGEIISNANGKPLQIDIWDSAHGVLLQQRVAAGKLGATSAIMPITTLMVLSSNTNSETLNHAQTLDAQMLKASGMIQAGTGIEMVKTPKGWELANLVFNTQAGERKTNLHDNNVNNPSGGAYEFFIINQIRQLGGSFKTLANNIDQSFGQVISALTTLNTLKNRSQKSPELDAMQDLTSQALNAYGVINPPAAPAKPTANNIK